jgi:hypothetical protein
MRSRRQKDSVDWTGVNLSREGSDGWLIRSLARARAANLSCQLVCLNEKNDQA